MGDVSSLGFHVAYLTDRRTPILVFLVDEALLAILPTNLPVRMSLGPISVQFNRILFHQTATSMSMMLRASGLIARTKSLISSTAEVWGVV